MNPPAGKHQTIDAYIAAFPADVRARLEAMRATIHAAAPDAEECISYAMPAFRQNGILVYFAAQKDGIGFYPTSSGIAAFQQELSGYKSTKGAVRFPHSQLLPLDLITRMVQFRVNETVSKAKSKTKRNA
jgi:uncharacterized protein YdhG (YjbR/CyaY superfamily)